MLAVQAMACCFVARFIGGGKKRRLMEGRNKLVFEEAIQTMASISSFLTACEHRQPYLRFGEAFCETRENGDFS